MSENRDMIVEFRHATVHGTHGKPILHEVSLAVRRGEKVLIWGPSGSGKTTLLLSILGRHQPAAGEILYRGQPINPTSIRQLRREVAYVAQEPLPGAETVRAALLLPFGFAANRHALPEEARLHEVLAQVGLQTRGLDATTRTFSGGEKQRLVLARAFLLAKETLLVDEPASALDETNEKNVLDLLLSGSRTVIAVSHNSAWRAAFARCHELPPAPAPDSR